MRNLNVQRVLWAELWFFKLFLCLLKIASYSYVFGKNIWVWGDFWEAQKSIKIITRLREFAERSNFTCRTIFLCSFQWCRFWQKSGDSIVMTFEVILLYCCTKQGRYVCTQAVDPYINQKIIWSKRNKKSCSSDPCLCIVVISPIDLTSKVRSDSAILIRTFWAWRGSYRLVDVCNSLIIFITIL
jgi:hypothetical protein